MEFHEPFAGWGAGAQAVQSRCELCAGRGGAWRGVAGRGGAWQCGAVLAGRGEGEGEHELSHKLRRLVSRGCNT